MRIMGTKICQALFFNSPNDRAQTQTQTQPHYPTQKPKPKTFPIGTFPESFYKIENQSYRGFSRKVFDISDSISNPKTPPITPQKHTHSQLSQIPPPNSPKKHLFFSFYFSPIFSPDIGGVTGNTPLKGGLLPLLPPFPPFCPKMVTGNRVVTLPPVTHTTCT